MVMMMRISDVMQASGNKRWKIYSDVREGLLPPPVKIGKRCAAWPSSEIKELIGARIAGKSESGIKALVAQLMADRKMGRG